MMGHEGSSLMIFVLSYDLRPNCQFNKNKLKTSHNPTLFRFNITTTCQFKIQYNICDLFHWYTPTRALRSASNISLVARRSKTVRYGKRLIDTSAVIVT